MRTRERSEKANIGIFQDFEVSFESCQDVNNKRSRPNSPCLIRRGRSNLFPIDTTYGTKNVLYVPPRSFSASVEGYFTNDVEAFRNSVVRKITSEKDKLIASFSSLNFAREMREITNPLKELVDKRFRYISYAFGIVPLVTDIKTALVEVDSRIASLNSKLERYRKPIPLNWGYSRNVSTDRTISYTTGNPHKEYLDARCKMRVKGEISMNVPVLAQVSPEAFNLLDTLAIDLSLGALWEALPFSWLVDWFIPTGLAFENMGSVMRPDVYFSGNISSQIIGSARLESLYSPPGYSFVSGQNGGVTRMKTFARDPYNGPASSLVSWDVVPRFDFHRAALLRDIIYRAPGKTIWHRL